jgi:hypothetical protein
VEIQIMSRFDDNYHKALEEEVYIEMSQRFADDLKLSPVNQAAIARLEQKLTVVALAANMAASKPMENIIQADDGMNWHKDIDILDNIYLCHRAFTDGTEYAIMEYFPRLGMYEIWNRSRNALDVLQVFTQEQRQALEIWKEDLTAQIRAFLLIEYPNQDMNHVAEGFMQRFVKPPSAI